MSLVRSNLTIVSGLYNFDQDPSAGAIGIINLGTHIPSGTIWQALLTVINSLTSATNAADISLGYIQTGVPIPVVSPLAFSGIALNVGTISPLLPITTIPGLGQLINFTDTGDLILTIANEALTAGSFRLDIFIQSQN